MSGTNSTTNLRNTMRYKISITPAFGSVMNARSEGLISDRTLKKLGIKAIHIEGMHHNLLPVHQTYSDILTLVSMLLCIVRIGRIDILPL